MLLLCFFLLFWFVLFTCLLSKERKGIELDGGWGGYNIGGNVGKKIMIKIYFMGKRLKFPFGSLNCRLTASVFSSLDFFFPKLRCKSGHIRHALV